MLSCNAARAGLRVKLFGRRWVLSCAVTMVGAARWVCGLRCGLALGQSATSATPPRLAPLSPLAPALQHVLSTFRTQRVSKILFDLSTDTSRATVTLHCENGAWRRRGAPLPLQGG